MQVSDLDDDGLLSEFRALQMLALYNGPASSSTTALEDDETAGDQAKKTKHMDEDLEEFLLQQVRESPWFELFLDSLPFVNTSEWLAAL